MLGVKLHAGAEVVVVMVVAVTEQPVFDVHEGCAHELVVVAPVESVPIRRRCQQVPRAEIASKTAEYNPREQDGRPMIIGDAYQKSTVGYRRAL